MHVVLVPRWSGIVDSDFYPWLRTQLGLPVSTVSLLPTPSAPSVDDTTRAVLDALRERDLPQTLVIGHSVGCQAAMRALAQLDEPVHALLCVAGWWSVDAPWDTLRPWQEPFAHERIRTTARVLISDNDPFTANFDETRRLFVERIAADVTIVPGARHFNGATELQVLEAVRSLL